MATTQPDKAAAQLLGRTLDGGWTVEQRVAPGAGATGATFSEGYVVRREDGTEGYLKALDYSLAEAAPDLPTALMALTQAFNFERDLVVQCAGARLSHVVTAYSHGEVDVPGHGVLSRVNYLIFERADRDARAQRDAMVTLDVAWVMRALHNVANGLRQLHARDITHQDLKPSNVMVFADCSKVGDLGRATQKGQAGPSDAFLVAGDRTYAPPELLYGHEDPNVDVRRRAAEAYHLGSLVAYFFTKVGTTPALAVELDPSQHWEAWGGSYHEVLPYVRDAFGRVVTALEAHLPGEVQEDVLPLFRELCDPDPAQRGHPKVRPGTVQRYSMDRYVTRFDLAARRAEVKLRRLLKP